VRILFVLFFLLNIIFPIYAQENDCSDLKFETGNEVYFLVEDMSLCGDLTIIDGLGINKNYTAQNIKTNRFTKFQESELLEHEKSLLIPLKEEYNCHAYVFELGQIKSKPIKTTLFERLYWSNKIYDKDCIGVKIGDFLNYYKFNDDETKKMQVNFIRKKTYFDFIHTISAIEQIDLCQNIVKNLINKDSLVSIIKDKYQINEEGCVEKVVDNLIEFLIQFKVELDKLIVIRNEKKHLEINMHPEDNSQKVLFDELTKEYDTQAQNIKSSFFNDSARVEIHNISGRKSSKIANEYLSDLYNLDYEKIRILFDIICEFEDSESNPDNSILIKLKLDQYFLGDYMEGIPSNRDYRDRTKKVFEIRMWVLPNLNQFRIMDILAPEVFPLNQPCYRATRIW